MITIQTKPTLPSSPTSAPSFTTPAHTPPARSLTRSEVRRAKDLRVRTNAAAVDILCARAEHLPRSDRDLVWAVFRQGLSLAQLESATHTPTRRLSRRLRSIVDRLNNPCFSLVVMRSHTWEARLAKVARCVFIEGRTLRCTSRQLGLSYAQTRAARDVIETLTATLAADKTLTAKEAA